MFLAFLRPPTHPCYVVQFRIIILVVDVVSELETTPSLIFGSSCSMLYVGKGRHDIYCVGSTRLSLQCAGTEGEHFPACRIARSKGRYIGGGMLILSARQTVAGWEQC